MKRSFPVNKLVLALFLMYLAFAVWWDVSALRDPYNPGYWFNRAFYKPTALCADGIYSFAERDSGRCSWHGGVKKEY
jgi:hypothetical protein